MLDEFFGNFYGTAISQKDSFNHHTSCTQFPQCNASPFDASDKSPRYVSKHVWLFSVDCLYDEADGSCSKYEICIYLRQA